MALLQLNFASRVLARQADVTVLLPERDEQFSSHRDKLEACRVLYLLHGLGGDRTSWTRNTRIENLVRDTNVAVIMPQVEHGFYTDMASGQPYFTFVAEELPRYLASILPLSSRREDTFVCGASMGGYGAFKLALTHPGRFSRAAALSGALDIQRFVSTFTLDGFDARLAFGERLAVAGTTDDLFYLLERDIAEGCELPALYSFCGTEDILLEESRTFAAHVRALRESGASLDFTAVEGPGEHLWTTWDANLTPALAWLLSISR